MSIRASLISFIFRRTLKKYFDEIDNVFLLREKMRKAERFFGATPENVTFTPQTVNGVNCEWVTLGVSDKKRVLLYLHGGGYAFGSPDSHRDLAWRLSAASGMGVLMVDYRLAPENPAPAAVEDSTRCYRWLLENGYEASNIAIGGDSAGGGLALATLLNAKNLNLTQPKCGVLLSPWTDLSISGDSVIKNAREDAVLTPNALHVLARNYLGSFDPKASLVSPLFGDLRDLPPLMVQVGSGEILRSDSERLKTSVEKAGGQIELEIWPKMPHVFQLFAARIPEGAQAISKLGEFLRIQISGSTR